MTYLKAQRDAISSIQDTTPRAAVTISDLQNPEIYLDKLYPIHLELSSGLRGIESSLVGMLKVLL